MKALAITRFASVTDVHGRQITVSWAEFIAMLTTPFAAIVKTMAPTWSPARFAGKRANANVVNVCALVLDFDDGLPVEDALRVAAGFAGAWHTSWSHTTACPRFRLALALSRGVTAVEYLRLWMWASAKFTSGALGPDLACKDAARAWFLPVKRPSFVCGVLSGSPLDVETTLAVSVPMPASPTRHAGHGRFSAAPNIAKRLPPQVEALLASSLALRSLWRGEKVVGDASRSGCDFAVARALLRANVPPDDVMAALRLRPNAHPSRGDYVQRTVLRALATLRGKP